MTVATPAFRALVAWPFICPNCDGELHDVKLYCSGHCEDEAAFVRYHRACIADGRYSDPKVRDIIEKKLALLMSGYSDRDRRVSKRRRREAIDADHGLCRKCGAPGTELDHIRGNSSDLANLQWLCSACHAEKTDKSFRTIRDDESEDEMLKRADVLERVWAPHPARPSDDPGIWKRLSQAVRNERRRFVRERNMRRFGVNCPVCLAKLPRRTIAEYRRTGERHARSCGRCFASRIYDPPCIHCGAEAMWRNESAWGCQACAGFGAL